VIASNTISENTADGFGGGVYCTGPDALITNNLITGNTAGMAGGGLRVQGATVFGNTIAGNHGLYGGGLSLSSSSTAANNIVAFNSSGVELLGTGTPVLKNNCVYGNSVYNYAGMTDPTGQNGNMSADPKLANFAYGNVHIQPDSPCRDSGGDFAVAPDELDCDGQPRVQGDRVDIGADESDGTNWPTGPTVIVRVSPEGDDANSGDTWQSPKRTIQAAIGAAALVGGDVWVRAGIYLERITLLPYVHVYGGFAGTEASREERNWTDHSTILDGQQGGSVVTSTAGHWVSTIDGFTIRNGRADFGGGFYCLASSPTIANNAITDNVSTGTGGGLYGRRSSSAIVNNDIASNTAAAGGGIYCENSFATIQHNKITGNTGGGISCFEGGMTIAKNTISQNSTTNLLKLTDSVPDAGLRK
jgi:parallel beta-helix repeat protein